MRKIEYIFIDSDTQAHSNKSDRHDVSNLRYHYVVNSQGCVINPTPVQLTTTLIDGPIYDPDKYNKCSIFIRYCGSLRPAAWLIEPEIEHETRSLKHENRCRTALKQREALINLLVELRKHFLDAKILGLSEIDSKEPYSRNIIVSDAMNVLRRKLSDYP